MCVVQQVEAIRVQVQLQKHNNNNKNSHSHKHVVYTLYPLSSQYVLHFAMDGNQNPSTSISVKNEPISKLGHRLAHLVANPLESDFEFYIDADVRTVPAHKIIISSASNVLHSIIYEPTLTSKRDPSVPPPSTCSTTTVYNISTDAFIVLLQFIYTDSTEQVEAANAMEILPLSDYYNLPALTNKCVSVILHTMTDDSACELYQSMSKMYSFPEILFSATQWIRFHSSDVFLCKAFANTLRIETIKQLFEEMFALNVDDEVVLFKALILWATAECDRRNVEKNAANFRLVLQHCEDHINFAAMTADEFDKCQQICPDFFSDKTTASTTARQRQRRPQVYYKCKLLNLKITFKIRSL